MTKQQMLWARHHDWYVKAYAISDTNYRVQVRPDVDDDRRWFNNFDELYAWAGY